MSEGAEKPKPAACEIFEPQAWRKTICRNCFQPPEKHGPSGEEGVPGPSGKENKPPAVSEKPKPGSKSISEDKIVSQKGEKDKTGTSIANSIKDKYEQLEKDKYNAKEPPKVAPKSTKGKPGLSAVTDKYEKFRTDAKIHESIPPSSQTTKDKPQGTLSKFSTNKDDQSNQSKVLNKSKFGSAENLSKIGDDKRFDIKLGQKSKFGSMENVSSVEKSKEPIQIPIQRSKFGGSVDNLSSEKFKTMPSNPDLAKRTLLNKLDDFGNELKAGATSTVGSTVIHKQTDGNVDVITIPKKSNLSKKIDNEALQNEMNELKMSRVGDKSGQIRPQKEKINEINNKTGSVDALEKNSHPSKTISPDRKPGFKLDIGKTEETSDSKPVRRNSGFKLDIGSASPEVKPGFKIDLRKSESPTKEPKRRNSGFKLEFDKSESPTKEPIVKSPEKKGTFKLNFDKSQSPTKELPSGEKKSGFKLNIGSSPSPTKDILRHDDVQKLDLKSGLKKAEVKQNEPSKPDLSKSEGKQKFELPQLKPTKDKTDIPQASEKKVSLTTDDKDNKREPEENKKEINRSDGKQKFELPHLTSAKSKNDEKPEEKINANAVTDENEKCQESKDIHLESKCDAKFEASIDLDKNKERKCVFDENKHKHEHSQSKSNITSETSRETSDSNIEKINEKVLSSVTPGVKENALNDSKLNGISVEVNVEHKSKDDQKDKLKPNDKSEPKGKFELPKLKSKSESKDMTVKSDSEKSSIGFGKLKTNELSDKGDKSDILKKKNQNSESGQKTDIKGKVESPFLKANKDTEEKKNAVDTKPHKMFEVPKLKTTKTEEKDTKSFKQESKFSVKDEPKRKFEVPSLKSSKDEKDRQTDKKWDLKAEDPKQKFDKPHLKSSKQEEKGKLSEKTDLKSDDKKKTFEVPKLKSARSDTSEKKEDKINVPLKKDDTKKKFEIPSLKSAKSEEKPKQLDKFGSKQQDESQKNKLDRQLLKSVKDKKVDNEKLEHDNKKSKAWEVDRSTTKTFEVPKLKSTKDQKIEQKPEDKAGKSNPPDEKTEKPKIDILKDSVEPFHTKHKGADERGKSGSILIEETEVRNPPSTSTIGTGNFEVLSADNEAKLSDEDYACADSASDTSYLHVDTQVFTSSRNKTAGVIGVDESILTSPRVSDLIITKKENKADDNLRTTNESSAKQNNEETSAEESCAVKSKEHEDNDTKSIVDETDEMSSLRKELILMKKRCDSLEKENISLKEGLNKRDDDQIELKQQKQEVEAVIEGLKNQLESIERTCEQLESDNKNLKNSLKAQVEQNKTNEEIISKSTSDGEHKSEEKSVEEIIEENEELKHEIADLKLEMDEMYDSFRDQEAEEFRELQKELEITAKNCRILQFKLRKLERHNDQVEQDRNQYEDRLRRLQDQFQDRDAVSHIHSLEDELRVSKCFDMVL